MSRRRSRFSCGSSAYPILRNSCFAGLLVLLGGCGGAELPACVVGKPAPSASQLGTWQKVPNATRIDVAIDGSGSMQGLTGSPKATAAWKAVLRGVSLAAASTGQPIRTMRSGSGQLQPLANVSQAGEPCFFSGCGAYPSVSSSLDAVWKGTLPAGPGVPLKVAISDLEVNEGDISGLVAAIKPHVAKGAVIAVLAVKLPFQGTVYNSQSEVVHTGQSQRPIYLLATGPQAQLKAFLNDVRTKVALGGVPTDTMQLTFLDEHVNRPTLKAASVQGVPPQAINSGLPLRLANSTYSPEGQSGFQFVKLLSQAEGVRLSSNTRVGTTQAKLSDTEVAVVQVKPVVLPSGVQSMGSGVSVSGLQLQGQQLLMELAIVGQTPAGALRATVPRGQLPEDWWIDWNRRDPSSASARDQTDGLLLLLTSLGTLLVEPGSTPAAAFCLAFSHS